MWRRADPDAWCSTMTQNPAPLTSVKVPIVDYLVLEPEPHLRAHECATCKARYFDRRNACANCSGTEFTDADVPTTGVLSTYTIVSFAPPGVDAPFVAAIVDCHGTSVRGKLLNMTPAPENVALGMPLRLATYSLGPDSDGVEAIGYGFEPVNRKDISGE
jgi:uncharacterized OB-fold protein